MLFRSPAPVSRVGKKSSSRHDCRTRLVNRIFAMALSHQRRCQTSSAGLAGVQEHSMSGRGARVRQCETGLGQIWESCDALGWRDHENPSGHELGSARRDGPRVRTRVRQREAGGLAGCRFHRRQSAVHRGWSNAGHARGWLHKNRAPRA